LDQTQFLIRLAERIRRLRLERGLRQEDIESYGLSWRAMQNIEYGQSDPKVTTLLKLCEAFGMTLPELLTLEEG
jgi:transcriptional regulator with XRE-family HTH domain